MRIGFGYDAHKMQKGDGVILGGIKIACEYSLVAHSDGDVLVHALMDAMLGALALGDIGKHFPDNDMAYKDIDSCNLLSKVVCFIHEHGYKIGNVDITVVAQHPRLSGYIDTMRKKLSTILETEMDFVGIKATTEENMGFTGRKEGICAYAVCLLTEI